MTPLTLEFAGSARGTIQLNNDAENVRNGRRLNQVDACEKDCAVGSMACKQVRLSC
jgi:hypothetical protein